MTSTQVTLIHDDCVSAMRSMPEDSVDAVVCDPPYDLTANKKGGSGVASIDLNSPYGRSRVTTGNGSGGFMGKSWDSTGVAFDPSTWVEALRVLKPGGYLLAFGGTRTVHRLACAIEDAGFEIRDSITWLYGSGFPKSLDVSKAIDKMAGAEREVVGDNPNHRPVSGVEYEGIYSGGNTGAKNLTTPATEAAKQWEGWGTALKPAHEPIVVARKPLSESSVARNVLEHGTGALNISASRIAHKNGQDLADSKAKNPGREDVVTSGVYGKNGPQQQVNEGGRWPANVVLSHSPECQRVGVKRVRGQNGGNSKAMNRGDAVYGNYGAVSPDGEAVGYADPDGFEEVEAWECVMGCTVAELDRQSGMLKSGKRNPGPRRKADGDGWGMSTNGNEASEGGASRFFYCAKASRSERNAGLEGMPEVETRGNYGDGIQDNRPHTREGYEYRSLTKNSHPTVKPLALMRYLVKLVTPPGGVVLDPFAGSGSTLVAAIQEGLEAVGIEREAEYIEIAERRIAYALEEQETKPLALDV